MAVISEGIGALTGDAAKDTKKMLDYIAYMREQVEFSFANLDRRVKALEEKGANNGT